MTDTLNNVLLFEQSYSKYRSRLCTIAKKILGDYSLAEDAVQSASINLFNRLDFYNWVDNSWSILKRSVINVSLKILRNRDKQKELFDRYYDSDVSPIEKMIKDEKISVVREQVEKLHKNYRQVLSISDSGLKYSEVGKRLGLTESQVKFRVCRGRRSLKERLDRICFRDRY